MGGGKGRGREGFPAVPIHGEYDFFITGEG